VEFTPVWLDPADVRTWLRDNAEPPANNAVELDRVCSQTEDHVQTVRADRYQPADPPDPDNPDAVVFVPDAETYQGAVMYAARLLRRRNTPTGVEFSETGAVFSPKYDPQIDQALHTGAYTRPRTG
jgi:hypothetical protein